MSVYLATGKDYTDMRGPCPEGYHILTYHEGECIAAWGGTVGHTEIAEKLHAPACGQLYQSTGNYTTYRPARRTSYNNGTYVYYLYMTTYKTAVDPFPTTYGISIRPVKDTVVYPDSSWTTEFSDDGLSIYSNSTLGLITIHDEYWNDGYDELQERMTIADKNLGATTRWNTGDTATAANSGNFYQWGNNYAFPFTGPASTSSASVNVDNYGPSNYYSSSVFHTNANYLTATDDETIYNLWGGETGAQPILKELESAYIGEYVDYLCFTANTAGSVVKIHKVKSPANVTLEFSTDKNTRSTYTFSNTISLTNIGDKVYFRNTSETDTQFSIDDENYYHFEMSGSVSGSGNITTLLNKKGTLTLSNYCFNNLFYNCSALTTPPDIPVTTVGNYSCYYMFYLCSNLTTVPKLPALNIGTQCYSYMFKSCTSLTTINKLPATTLTNYCYTQMYRGCTQIKLSSTQTGEYQTPYRIPIIGTGTSATSSLDNMFSNTGGTFTSSPSINTTYYTSNTVI